MLNVTGVWGHDNVPFLDLAFDGVATVSGTTYWRAGRRTVQAEIKNGSFDPKRNALRLEGVAPSLDGEGVSDYAIDGRLDQDTITGTYDCGGLTGTFSFSRIGSST